MWNSSSKILLKQLVGNTEPRLHIDTFNVLMECQYNAGEYRTSRSNLTITFHELWFCCWSSSLLFYLGHIVQMSFNLAIVSTFTNSRLYIYSLNSLNSSRRASVVPLNCSIINNLQLASYIYFIQDCLILSKFMFTWILILTQIPAYKKSHMIFTYLSIIVIWSCKI